MKDLFDILTSLGTPLVRGTKAVLTGKVGREACYIGWLTIVLQALEAISHADGVVSGVLTFGTLMVVLAVSMLTAFMTANGNEYEPNRKDVQGRKALTIAMVINGTVVGTIVAALLLGLVLVVSSIKEPISLIFVTAVYSAVHSWLVNYLLRRHEKGAL